MAQRTEELTKTGNELVSCRDEFIWLGTIFKLDGGSDLDIDSRMEQKGLSVGKLVESYVTKRCNVSQRSDSKMTHQPSNDLWS